VSEIWDLQSDVRDLRAENRDLRTDVDELLADNQRLKTELVDLKRWFTALRNRVDQHELVGA
jgi:regulator of replication initiation timing